jgi:hypothetical protein
VLLNGADGVLIGDCHPGEGYINMKGTPPLQEKTQVSQTLHFRLSISSIFSPSMREAIAI